MKEAGTRSRPGPDITFIFKIACGNSSRDIHMCSSLTGESSKAVSWGSDIVNDDLKWRAKRSEISVPLDPSKSLRNNELGVSMV